jgi:hypothetical protein
MKVFQPKIFALVGVVKPVEVPLLRAVELLCRVILKTRATSFSEVALVFYLSIKYYLVFTTLTVSTASAYFTCNK